MSAGRANVPTLRTILSTPGAGARLFDEKRDISRTKSERGLAPVEQERGSTDSVLSKISNYVSNLFSESKIIPVRTINV